MSATTRRIRPAAWVLLAVVALSPAVGRAEPAVSPAPLAFNRGVYKKDAIDAAVQKGVAEHVVVSIDRSVVRSLRVEVFENSKVAATDQTVLFALCESTFHSTLNSGRMLIKFTAEYVILDASGKPIGPNAWRLEYTENAKRNGWTKSLDTGATVDKFHRGLPEWAKKKLWVLSGFLSKNPGQPPVPFAKTLGEDVVAVLGELLDFAPGVAKKAVGAVVENGLKKLSKAGLEAAVKSEDVRWGHGVDLSHEKITKYSDEYQRAGKALWGG